MYSLPENQRQIVDKYFHIKFGSFVLPCPYYMNKRGRRFLSVVDAGKGTPEEIEIELAKWLNKFNREILDEVDARSLLTLLQIGVDCSGFVVNVLGLESKIKYPNSLLKLRFLLRPRTNISADLLTGSLNSAEVNLSEVKPGDLIRIGKSHLTLVEWVDGQRFGYVGSGVRPQWGVQRGEVEVINPDKSLEDQVWSVPDDLVMYKRAEGGKGVRRLK